MKRLQAEYPNLDIEWIEVTVHPVRAWKDGVRIFPAVRIGEETLSGFILSPENVRRFVTERMTARSGSLTEGMG